MFQPFASFCITLTDTYTCGAGIACLPVYMALFRNIFIKSTEELVAGGIRVNKRLWDKKMSRHIHCHVLLVTLVLIFSDRMLPTRQREQKNNATPCYTGKMPNCQFSDFMPMSINNIYAFTFIYQYLIYICISKKIS